MLRLIKGPAQAKMQGRVLDMCKKGSLNIWRSGMCVYVCAHVRVLMHVCVCMHTRVLAHVPTHLYLSVKERLWEKVLPTPCL